LLSRHNSDRTETNYWQGYDGFIDFGYQYSRPNCFTQSTLQRTITRGIIYPKLETNVYLAAKAVAFLAENVILNPAPGTFVVGEGHVIDTFAIVVKAAAG
jgi:hypothetical protein